MKIWMGLWLLLRGLVPLKLRFVGVADLPTAMVQIHDHLIVVSSCNGRSVPVVGPSFRRWR